MILAPAYSSHEREIRFVFEVANARLILVNSLFIRHSKHGVREPATERLIVLELLE